jgi:hypothetical protein
MTWLRSIFLAKENFETYCAEEIIKLLKASTGPPSVWLFVKCGVALLGFLVVLWGIVPPNSFGPTYMSVKQGEYKPRLCSTWKFLPHSEDFLQGALRSLSILSKETGQPLITGNHVGIPFCVIQYENRVMLNPQITGMEDTTHSFYITSAKLCTPRPKEQQKEMLFAERITLSWFSGEHAVETESFTAPVAYELQLALKIINGEDICNDKVK